MEILPYGKIDFFILPNSPPNHCQKMNAFPNSLSRPLLGLMSMMGGLTIVSMDMNEFFDLFFALNPESLPDEMYTAAKRCYDLGSEARNQVFNKFISNDATMRLLINLDLQFLKFYIYPDESFSWKILRENPEALGLMVNPSKDMILGVVNQRPELIRLVKDLTPEIYKPYLYADPSRIKFIQSSTTEMRVFAFRIEEEDYDDLSHEELLEIVQKNPEIICSIDFPDLNKRRLKYDTEYQEKIERYYELLQVAIKGNPDLINHIKEEWIRIPLIRLAYETDPTVVPAEYVKKLWKKVRNSDLTCSICEDSGDGVFIHCCFTENIHYYHSECFCEWLEKQEELKKEKKDCNFDCIYCMNKIVLK